MNVNNSPQPYVDIITPVRNGAPFISDYVFSLRSQTYTSWRAILVDDNSTDNSFSILSAEVAGDSRFILVSLPDHVVHHPGPAFARNYALSLSSAPLISFHDIDDLWHPDRLSLQVAYHISSKLDLSTSSYCRFSESIYQSDINLVRPPSSVNPYSLLHFNPIPMLTVLVSSALIKYPFPDIPHEDYAFWILNILRHKKISFGSLPLALAFYRVHSSNTSGKHFLLPFWVFNVFRHVGYSPVFSAFLLIRFLILHAFMHFLRFFRRSRLESSVIQQMEQRPHPLTPS